MTRALFSIVLFSVLSLVLFSAFIPSPSYATDPIIEQFAKTKTGAGIPAVPHDPRSVAARIIRIFTSVLGVIAIVLLIYAGFLWMTSSGNEEQVKKAKGLLTAAIIGLIIILTAYSVSRFIFTSLENASVIQ